MEFHLTRKNPFFALSEGKLLGFIVSKSGIHIDPDRIKEISAIPLPHNKKAMQSFLFQISFIKRFVPDFSRIVSPLQAMIKNKSIFKWDQDKYEAFNLIKQAIINAPYLATPNFSDPFILCTFASDRSYATILTQVNQEKANVYKIKGSEKFGVAKDGALMIACLIRLNASCSSWPHLKFEFFLIISSKGDPILEKSRRNLFTKLIWPRKDCMDFLL